MEQDISEKQHSLTADDDGKGGDEICEGRDDTMGSLPVVMTPVNEIQPPSPAPSEGNDGGVRRASSRIASLRATFEGKQSPLSSMPGSPDGVKRLKSPTPGGRAEIQQLEAEVLKFKDQLAHESALRVAYEDRCTVLETQLTQKETEWRSEMERIQGEQGRENAQQKGEDTTTLQRQVFELKKSISAATRLDTQMADTAFGQDMQQLFFLLQNWVVTNFRRIETTPEDMCARLERIAEAEQVELLRPICQNFEPRLAAIQAVTISLMMDIFQEPLLFGIPPDTNWRQGIKKAFEALPSVLSPSAFNKWRSITLDTLKTGVEMMEDYIESASIQTTELICVLLDTLLDIEESAARQSSLQALVKRTISLAHLFRVQQAHYEFVLPAPGSPFLPDTMADDALEGASPPDCVIRCATFPSVYVWHDNGSSVVIKAKVLTYSASSV